MKRIIITAIIVAIGFAGSAFATIINIPEDYSTIQQGIDASSNGDTVLVQPGMYVENINFNGHNIVLGSLFLTTGETAYILETIIDGDSSGSVVIFESEEDDSAIIAGFTLRNGGSIVGGGILCEYSSPIIEYNNITNNVVEFAGAGICCFHSGPFIGYNVIADNIARGWDASNGAGIFIHEESSPIVVGNTIKGNLCGDGIVNDGTGGGIGVYMSNPYIGYNLITLNNASLGGGGIYSNSSPLELFNNIIVNNSCGVNEWGKGGGICIGGEVNNLFNNILLGNSSSSEGGGIWSSGATLYGSNNIIYGNDAPAFREIFWRFGNIDFSYCDIREGWNGNGNIDADPLFRDPENGDYHLMSVECGDPYDSPCIDTGNPSIDDIMLDCGWGLGELRSDMGAYGGGDSVIVGIDYISKLPDRFALLQNYPNPFNPSTTIRYSLPEATNVRIEIYNILGQRVATLFDGNKQAGYHSVTWQADDYPSGIYFAKLRTLNESKSIKMLLLR